MAWASRSLSVSAKLARVTLPLVTGRAGDCLLGKVNTVGCDQAASSAIGLQLSSFFGRDTSSLLAKSGYRCFGATPLPEKEYHDMADQCIDDLHETIENFLEDVGAEPYDVEYGQGVLTVKLGPRGTFVINKQTPNRQIWLSSPVSGPFRYDPVGGQWVYSRDAHTLHEKLKQEISSLTGHEITI